MLMALLAPHQSGAPPETGRAVRLQQTAPASRRDSPPAPFTSQRWGTIGANGTHRCCSASRPEKDFLVTERIWFPCRNLGKEKPTGQPDQVQPGWAGGHAAAVGNSQPLQLLQGGERPVHVFDGPGDLVLLEVPVDRHRDTTLLKRSRRHDVNKTLCGFTFRVKCSGYSKQLWDQRGVLCGAVAAFLCRLKNVFYGDYTAV